MALFSAGKAFAAAAATALTSPTARPPTISGASMTDCAGSGPRFASGGRCPCRAARLRWAAWRTSGATRRRSVAALPGPLLRALRRSCVCSGRAAKTAKRSSPLRHWTACHGVELEQGLQRAEEEPQHLIAGQGDRPAVAIHSSAVRPRTQVRQCKPSLLSSTGPRATGWGIDKLAQSCGRRQSGIARYQGMRWLSAALFVLRCT